MSTRKPGERLFATGRLEDGEIVVLERALAAATVRLLKDVRSRGWSVLEAEGRRSRANPFTGNLTLAERSSETGMRKSPFALLMLAVHEHVHVRQWGSPWWRRWWRGVLYVFNPRVRVLVEIEGVAHALVAFRLAGGLRHVAVNLIEDYVEGLSGLRWPYLTAHPFTWVASRLRDRIAALAPDQ